MKNIDEKDFTERNIGCDWCGSMEPVANTSYGTSNYTRVVCKECYKKLGGE